MTNKTSKLLLGVMCTGVIILITATATSRSYAQARCDNLITFNDSLFIFNYNNCPDAFRIRDDLTIRIDQSQPVIPDTFKCRVAAVVDVAASGFYEFSALISYSGEESNGSQINESYFFEILEGDRSGDDPCNISPSGNIKVCIPNAGFRRVIVSDFNLTAESTIERNSGTFFLQGNSTYTILLKHLELIENELTDSERANLIRGDGFGNLENNGTYADPESVHLQRLTISRVNHDLRIDKRAMQGLQEINSIAPGEAFNYELTVENAGPDTAFGFNLWDQLPPSVTPLSYRVTYPDGGSTFTTLSANAGELLSIQLDSLSRDLDPANPSEIGLLVNQQLVVSINVQHDGSTAINPFENVAYLDSCDIDASNDTSRASVSLLIADTDVTINKSVSPQIAQRNQIFTYTLEVINLGSSAADSVSVTDTLPDSLAFGRFVDGPAGMRSGSTSNWDLGTIAANDTIRLSFEAMFDTTLAMPADTLRKTNTATVAAANDTNLSNNTDDATVAIYEEPIVQIADVAINKSVNPTIVAKSASFIYTIEIINTGPDPADSVVVTDILPDSLSFMQFISGPVGSRNGSATVWDLGTMVVNDTITLAFEAIYDTILAMPADTVVKTNTVTVSAANDTTPNNNSDQATITIYRGDIPPPKTDLVITKTVTPAFVDQKTNFTYTLIINNLGQNAADSVVVTDVLPDSVIFLQFVQGPAGLQNGNSISWSLGDLVENDADTIRFAAIYDTTFTLPSDTLIRLNTASVSAKNDTNSANNSDNAPVTIVRPQPANTDVMITKSVNPAIVMRGQSFTYTLEVTNLGPNAADSVIISDVLADSLTFNGFSGDLDGSLSGRELQWDLGTMAVNPDTPVTLSFKVVYPTALKLPTGIDTLALPNTALVAASNDTNATNNSSDALIRIVDIPRQRYDIGISKSANPDTVFPGQPFVYTIQVTNHGPATAEAIIVADARPPDLLYSDFSQTPLDESAEDTLKWQIASLISNETLMLTYNAMVPASAQVNASKLFVNMACVLAPNDTNAINGCASDTVVCLPSPFNCKEDPSTFYLDRNIFAPDDPQQQPGLPGELQITLSVDQLNDVTLDIVDMTGYHIRSIIKNRRVNGTETFPWDGYSKDGKKVGSGYYFVVLRDGGSGGQVLECVRKVIVVR